MDFTWNIFITNQTVPLQFSIGELQNMEDVQFQICQVCGETIVGNMAEGSLYKSGQLCSIFKFLKDFVFEYFPS